MTDAQRSGWLGAGLVIVIALLGITLWKVTQNDPAKQIAALNAKVEATENTLAKIQEVVASREIRQQLGELGTKIEKTNAALAELQKGTALKSVADKLEQLNTAIRTTDTTLADITNSIPQKGLGNKVEAIGTDVKSISDKVADLQKSAPAGQAVTELGARVGAIGADLKTISTKLADLQKNAPAGQAVSQLGVKVETISADLKTINTKLGDLEKNARTGQVTAKIDEIKRAIPPDVTSQLTALSTQVRSISDTVTKLQRPNGAAGTDKAAALSDAVGSLKTNVDEAAALRDRLAEQIASLQEATKTIAKPQPSDVVVVYLDMPEESARPQTVATVSPLTVAFEKVGSTDPDGQANMLATKLKDIIKGRKNCTISVAGYADTMGRDDWNLTISKRRARKVAEKLKVAFAGQDVQINEAAWGERRLKDWTPDETPNAMNRRVDVSVSCK
jgi:outer membrane protein OmpA-like peptidoglycan-associated protein